MAFCNMCGTQIADGTTTLFRVCGQSCNRTRYRDDSGRRGNDRQRGWHAGLHHHHSSDHFPGDGTVQQESIYPFPRMAVFAICGSIVGFTFGLSVLAVVPFLALITLPLHLLVSLGRIHSVDHRADQGKSGTNVQAAGDRRHRGKAGECDVA